MEERMKYELSVLEKLLDMLHTVGFNMGYALLNPDEVESEHIELTRTVADSVLVEVINKITYWPEEYPEPSDKHTEMANNLKVDGLKVIKLIQKSFGEDVPSHWLEMAGTFDLA